METFSALLVTCAGNSPVTDESPHKVQWQGALVFYLICSWINSWVKNGVTGHLGRHRTHHDVTVMQQFWFRLIDWRPNATHWTGWLFLFEWLTLLFCYYYYCPLFPNLMREYQWFIALHGFIIHWTRISKQTIWQPKCSDMWGCTVSVFMNFRCMMITGVYQSSLRKYILTKHTYASNRRLQSRTSIQPCLVLKAV